MSHNYLDWLFIPLSQGEASIWFQKTAKTSLKTIHKMSFVPVVHQLTLEFITSRHQDVNSCILKQLKTHKITPPRHNAHNTKYWVYKICFRHRVNCFKLIESIEGFYISKSRHLVMLFLGENIESWEIRTVS